MKRHIPPKRRALLELYVVTTQKTAVLFTEERIFRAGEVVGRSEADVCARGNKHNIFRYAECVPNLETRVFISFHLHVN
jgi:hypothetical protein